MTDGKEHDLRPLAASRQQDKDGFILKTDDDVARAAVRRAKRP